MVRLALLACAGMVLVACSRGLTVDPALAESIEQIGMATTGQFEISRDQWVDIAKMACDRGAHLDLAEAERIAVEEGVVFIGTDRPVVETVQVIGEAVCSVNNSA